MVGIITYKTAPSVKEMLLLIFGHRLLSNQNFKANYNAFLGLWCFIMLIFNTSQFVYSANQSTGKYKIRLIILIDIIIYILFGKIAYSIRLHAIVLKRRGNSIFNLVLKTNITGD